MKSSMSILRQLRDSYPIAKPPERPQNIWHTSDSALKQAKKCRSCAPNTRAADRKESQHQHNWLVEIAMIHKRGAPSAQWTIFHVRVNNQACWLTFIIYTDVVKQFSTVVAVYLFDTTVCYAAMRTREYSFPIIGKFAYLPHKFHPLSYSTY